MATIYGNTPSADRSVELELMMTRSTFAHEYAMMNLYDEAPYSNREGLLLEMEAHKDAYFSAREELHALNPSQLALVEERLRFQKESLFEKSRYLH